MKKILGSIALAGLPLLFASAVAFTPVAASANTGFVAAWHHVCNWHPFGGNSSGKGAIVVIKRSFGGNGTFQMSGNNGIGNFSITTGSHWHFGVKTLKHLDAGSYSITENVPSGWTQVSSTCANVTVKAHRTAFCVIVNQKGAPDTDPTPTGDTGSLTVTKTALGSNGDVFSVTDGTNTYNITTSNGSGTVTISNIPVGPYALTENETSGWTLSDSTCDSGEVTIVKDQTATCTITNTKDAVPAATGNLIINKIANGGSGQFTFVVTDSTNATQALDPITAADGAPGQEEVPGITAGTFTISENAQSGWTNGAIFCATSDSPLVDTRTIPANGTVTCAVTNTKVANGSAPAAINGGGGGGGGNGPPAGGGSGGSGWTFNFPQVLGASSTTLPELPPGCSALLTKFMRKGKPNDVSEVKKLQQFLNDELGANLPISGFFGSLTDKAVRQFQLLHKPQVLTPWGITDPTGYVYKTTERWINISWCSTLDIPMPELN